MSVPNPTRREAAIEKDGEHANGQRADAALARIGDALRGLRFGTVLAIVQDGVVVQIERTEKTRLDRNSR